MRQTSSEDVQKNIIRLLEKGNIHIHVDLIAGLPYETLQDFKVSFNRAYALGAHNLQLGFLKLLHGSKLREQAAELQINFDPNPPYQIIDSNWISVEDLEILELAENALRNTYNKGRFLTSIKYVLEVTGLNPFDYYLALGKAAKNHGTDLSDYAQQFLEFNKDLPNVKLQTLKDHLTYDWLAMVKGKNMPKSLKNASRARNDLLKLAQKNLNHTIRRDEVAILLNGTGIYVDSESKDPVTGLYTVHCVKSPCT